MSSQYGGARCLARFKEYSLIGTFIFFNVFPTTKQVVKNTTLDRYSPIRRLLKRILCYLYLYYERARRNIYYFPGCKFVLKLCHFESLPYEGRNELALQLRCFR